MLGVLPGIIGALQALEAIKLIIGQGAALTSKVCHFDALNASFRTFTVPRAPGCQGCSEA